MRIVCHLRGIRGQRTMRQIADTAATTGVRVSQATISQVERGLMLPPDPLIPALEQAYGAPITDWYEPRVLLVLQADEDTA